MRPIRRKLEILILGCMVAGVAWAQEPADSDRQKQTVVAMRTVGKAFMSWLTDEVSGDAAASATLAGQDQEHGWTARMESEAPQPYALISYATMTELLVPDYIDAVPEGDGWGHPYQFALNVDLIASRAIGTRTEQLVEGVDIERLDLHGRHVLGIRSAGRDGRFETADYIIGGFPAREFDRDLVWGNGYFIRWPTAEKTEG